MTAVPRLLIVGAVAIAGAVLVAGALCRFAIDCHLRALPLVNRLAHEPPVLAGVQERGTGATGLPEGFAQETVATNLNLPTSFAELPDGRFLIAEKDGLVRVVDDGQILARPFIDLRRVVDSAALRGLVMVKASPDFARTGFVYLLYARKLGPQQRTLLLTRVTASGNSALPASEEVILGAADPRACARARPPSACLQLDGDHQGGEIEFLEDGTLFVSLGDGGGEIEGVQENAFRAQSLESLSGKLLRITAEGAGIPSNPFWDGNPRSNRSKIWAYGLRNPFRLGLRPSDETPFVGDAGWNAWDEIDVATRGANLGWPCFEGDERTTGYRDQPLCQALYRRAGREVARPLVVYENASVTGGAFYTGRTYPPRFHGAYFFGDWARSTLSYVQAPALTSIRATPIEFATRTAGPVQIEMGSDGNLFYLSLNAGELRRLIYSGG